MDRPWLQRAKELAEGYLDSLPDRTVRAVATTQELRAAFGGPLPDAGEDPTRVVEALARTAEPGLVATAGPRYFGFVNGGSLPASVAADWLVSAWDQNGAFAVMSHSVSAAEDVVADWVKELIGLPEQASVGFVSGCQMANFTGLAAGRHAVLSRAGWDVEQDGLQGAPAIQVVAGDEAHVTVFSALRLLGLGSGRVIRVPADGQGRMIPGQLRQMLGRLAGPIIVCAQAGNVNTGAFDPLEEIAEITGGAGAWLHVDGAFGIWAAAAPARRHLAKGLHLADSWATDAHKWLNVPYDSGLVIVADPAAHTAAMSMKAAYLQRTEGARDGSDYAPDSSRRARVFPLYAALRSLGRAGVAELVERCCCLAARMADGLRRDPLVRILNDVVLNQVLVRFEPPGGGDADAFTRAVIAGVQREGTCWLGGTRWHEMEAMRISVSNWSTTKADADRSVEAILRVAHTQLSH